MPTTKENKLNSRLEDVEENVENLWKQMREKRESSSEEIKIEEEEKKLKELMFAETDWRKKIILASKIISLKL